MVSVMDDPLRGPRIKLERAYNHLEYLERTEKDFFRKNPCRIVFDTISKPGKKIAKLTLDARPPEILHVLSGELVYQLRSSLDQMAVALARLSASKPNPSVVHFPSGDGVKGFKASCRKNLKGFDCDFVKEVIRLRPYDGANELLRAVFRMANIDKHMELIAIGAVGNLSTLSNFNFYGCSIVISGPSDLHDGVTVAEMTPDGRFEPRNSDAKIEVAGQVTLGDVSVYHGRPLIPFLRAMLEATEVAYVKIWELLVVSGRITMPIIYWPPPSKWFDEK